jgi:hypothetical protein
VRSISGTYKSSSTTYKRREEFSHGLDRFRSNKPPPSLLRKKMLRNLVAFFLVHDNIISQHSQLGLFDRRADEKALRYLLNPPAIPGLTESLTALSSAEWRTLLSRLRRTRLLAGEDPDHPGENWTLIPLFVNFLANSCVADEPRLGKKASAPLRSLPTAHVRFGLNRPCAGG